MNIQGKKQQDGKNSLKLGDQSHLSLSCRVKDIGGGKAHLITDQRPGKFSGHENQLGQKPDQQTENCFLGKQQCQFND